MTLFIGSREELEHLVVARHLEGWGIRALTRHFKMGRNTIRRILRKHRTRRDEGHDVLERKKKGVPKQTKLDPFVPLVKELLEKFPDIKGQRVYEELRNEGYTGSISVLRDRLQELRPTPKHEPIIRFETEPGEQGQMDWSPYTINFKRTGKAKVLCFSYILGFSRRQFIDFALHRDFYTLIRRHQDAFQYFEGVPKQCLYDSEKTVVLRWEAGQPVHNPAFVAFITHYNCKPIICSRGRAQTKGKVERPFQYLESNLFNAREFQDSEDLRSTAKWWLKERSDLHNHDTTGRPPIELFTEQEQAALQALPLHPYDSSEVALRICGLDGFIEFETNRYSVPYKYLADILTMKATEREVFIYSPELDLIAHHERLPAGAGKKVEKPEHHASKRARYGLEPVKDTFIALGEAAEHFMKELKQKHPRNCGFHARYILQLKKQYLCDDIHKALAHAIRYQAFDCRSIERILQAKATPRTLESIRNERAKEELRKALPKIKQRSLSEYSVLLQAPTIRMSGQGEDNEKESGIITENQDPKLSKNPQTEQNGECSG